MNLPHNHNEDATACQFLQEKIGDTENFQAVADVFKQLGDSTRQLVAVAAKEFDAVIMERIVGSRNHDTCLGLVTSFIRAAGDR